MFMHNFMVSETHLRIVYTKYQRLKKRLVARFGAFLVLLRMENESQSSYQYKEISSPRPLWTGLNTCTFLPQISKI